VLVPLSSANIVQSNVSSTGAAAAAATVTVTLGSATTAGTTVIVGMFTGAQAMATPAGWTLDLNATSQIINVWRKGGSGYAGGETSWGFTTTVSTTTAAWFVLEVDGLDDDPVDASSTGGVNGTPQTVGTIAQNSAYDTMALAIHVGSTTTSPVGTFSGQTGGYTELGEAGSTVAPKGLALSTLFAGDVTSFASTATKTGNFVTGSGGAQIVYRAAGSPVYPSIAHHAGFGHRTEAGINTGAVTAAQFDLLSGGTVGTNLLVQSGGPYAGDYHLRLVASAAEVGLGLFGAAGRSLTTGLTALTAGFWVQVVSSTGTVVLWTGRDTPALNTLQLVYDTSTTKLGVRWVTGAPPGTPGTATWQAGTTAASTWVRVDICMSSVKGTTRDMLWSLDGVAQTSAAQLTGTSTSTIAGTVMGQWTAYGTQTVTADYAHWRVSTSKVDYPLGDQRVVLLKVDPAGTVTLSGTATNFQTFAGATPTLTAWNATTARNAVDEVPPGLGASADGFAQILAAASDYVETPMETYTLAAGEVIVAVRALVAGWAAGASAIGLRGFDGTAETVLWAVADPTWNNSATAPGWLAKRWIILPRWTQAKLDAAALRLGFGTSATDIGVHALYLEVVIGSSTRLTLFGDASTADYDPGGNYAVTEIDVTGPQGGDTSLYYETNTTPTTVTVPASTSHTETVDAPSAAATNYIAAYWPPEGVPDA
jgi:hypothetical protein